MSILKIYSKRSSTLSASTDYNMTPFEVDGAVQNIKNWICPEWNLTFLWNKKLLDCVWKLIVSEILDDRYYSFCEYNMDDMGIYLETPEKKQEIMQKKLWAW